MGADPTVSDRYQTTPLHFASNFRKEDIAMAMVTMLLPFIKDVNVQDNEGYTPLYNALINRNYIGIADMLLEKDNININVQDNYGNTLLHIACQMRKLDNVRFLLSNSAIPTIRNRNGMTPIQLTSDETIQKIMQNAISARDITRQSKMRKSNLNKNLKSSMFTGKKRHGGNKRKTKRSRTQP
jgi:ankyrin repeat protein